MDVDRKIVSFTYFTNPEHADRSNRFSALASTIIRAVYGLEVRDTNEPYVVNAERLLGGLAEAGVPGAFLVDTLPFRMLYFPHYTPPRIF